jgi:glycosyltransferase involved in cell wall biosynthesis
MLLVDSTFTSRGFGGIAQDNRAFQREFARIPNTTFLFDKNHKIVGTKNYSLNSSLRKLNIEALFLNKAVLDTVWDGPFFQIHLTGLKSPALRSKTYLRIHDIFPITNPEWFPFAGRKLFQVALRSLGSNTTLVCNSETTKKSISQNPFLSRLESIVVGCKVFSDMDSMSPCNQCAVCMGSISFENKLISVGTLEPRKNYVRLLEAWNEIAIRSQFSGFIIAGKLGWNFKHILAKMKNTKNFEWITPCNFGMQEVYSKAKGYISASLDEGFDMPSMEAAYFGLESALSNIAVHKELHPQTRIFFNPVELQEIKQAILSFRSPHKVELKDGIQDRWNEEFQKLLDIIEFE